MCLPGCMVPAALSAVLLTESWAFSSVDFSLSGFAAEVALSTGSWRLFGGGMVSMGARVFAGGGWMWRRTERQTWLLLLIALILLEVVSVSVVLEVLGSEKVRKKPEEVAVAEREALL